MKKIDSLQVEGVCARARFPLAAVALAAAVCTQGVAAQEAKLATTVVTAARAETPLQDTLGDVSVITREQISSLAGSRSVGEVLQRFAGVQYYGNGGRGHSQAVMLRGLGNGYTMLMIDGVRYGSLTLGGPALDNIPLEMIERIEVIQGPASAMYGSDAVAGVIHIMTKQGQGSGQPFSAHASSTLGEYGHKAGNFGFRGEQGAVSYQFNIHRMTEHGISAANAKAGLLTYNEDRDAFDQTAVNVGMGLKLHRDWRLDALLTQSEGTVFSDSGANSNPYADMRSQIGSFKLAGRLPKDWETSVSVSQSQDTQDNQASSPSRYVTEQTEYKWDNRIATPLGKLLAGVEHLQQDIEASEEWGDYRVKQRSIDALFLGLHGHADRHSWQANVRHDDNSQFGGFTSYGVNYGFELAEGLRAYAAHGKSFRVPTFNQLYYKSRYGNGNPNLLPEEGLSNELGVQWDKQSHQFKLLAFDNTVTNLITAVNSVQANIDGETRLQGWSFKYGFNQAGWEIGLTHDFLNAKQADGQTLVRRAKHQTALNLDKHLGAWKLGASALRVGARNDNDYSGSWPYPTVRMPAYITVDAHAQYQINGQWSVLARVANLTNKSYETAYGYNQLGRAAYVTLKWQMK